MSEMDDSDSYQTLKNGKGFKKQYTDPVTGRRRSLTCPTVCELFERLAEIRKVRRNLRFGMVSQEQALRDTRNLTKDVYTVRDVWKEYAATQKRRAVSAADYDVRIKPYLGDRLAVECSEAVIREWIKALEAATYTKGGKIKHYSPKTIMGTFERLAAAYGLAVRSKRLLASPFAGFRPKLNKPEKRPAARSLDQLEALVKAAVRFDQYKFKLGQWSDRAVAITVFGLTGMRQGEAAGLGWDDLLIDQPTAQITIRHQARDGWRTEHPEWVRPLDPPKNGSARTAILHEGAANALRWQRAKLKERGWYRESGPVFPNGRSKTGEWRANHEVIDPVQLRELGKEVGLHDLERWVTHGLRHSFCSLEAKSGNLKAVQERAGHSSLAQTEHYIHALGEGLPQPGIAALSGSVFGAMPTLDLVASSVIDESGAIVITASLAPLADLSKAMQPGWEEIRKEKDRVLAARMARAAKWAREERDRPTPILDLARAHPEGMPSDVGALADKRYQRSYQAALRAGVKLDDAKEAGKKARRAFVGVFKRLQAKVREEQVSRNEAAG